MKWNVWKHLTLREQENKKKSEVRQNLTLREEEKRGIKQNLTIKE